MLNFLAMSLEKERWHSKIFLGIAVVALLMAVGCDMFDGPPVEKAPVPVQTPLPSTAIYSDSLYPFHLEYPASWAVVVYDRPSSQKGLSAIPVRRIMFSKQFTRPKPVPMLELSFYESSTRMTRPNRAMRENPETPTIEVNGIKMTGRRVGSAGWTFLFPEFPGVNCRIRFWGPYNVGVGAFTLEEFGRREEEYRDIEKAVMSLRWDAPNRPQANSQRFERPAEKAPPLQAADGMTSCVGFSDKTTDELIASLKNSRSAYHSRCTVDTLAQRGQDALPAILKVFFETKIGVTSSLTTAIIRINPKDEETAAMFLKALSHENLNIRADSAKILGYMGAKQAVPQLQELLKDPHPNVRFSAARALKELETGEGRRTMDAISEMERR